MYIYIYMYIYIICLYICMYHVLIPRILVNQLDIFYLIIPVLMVQFLPLSPSLSPPLPSFSGTDETALLFKQ